MSCQRTTLIQIRSLLGCGLRIQRRASFCYKEACAFILTEEKQKTNLLCYYETMYPLLVIFCSILATFLVSRFVAYAVLVWRTLPQKTLSNGNRPHHFVYGNILIVIASFAVIGLGVDPTNIVILIAYGVGLGLVLDEFPHWLGNIKELQRNVPIIRGGLIATLVALGFILVALFVKIALQ